MLDIETSQLGKRRVRQACHSLAHAEHPVNFRDAQPVQDIGHQGLETHVFDPRDVLGPLEIVRCTIFPALAGIVHDCRFTLDGQ